MRYCPLNPPNAPWVPYIVFMTNKHANPYVQTLLESGYDQTDIAATTNVRGGVTYPREIHGRVYNTESEYNEAIADFLNGL